MLVSADWKAADVLDAIASRIPRELVRPAALEACRALAATLPSAVASQYLECRLGDDDQVDYLAALGTAHVRDQALHVAGSSQTNRLLEGIARRPIDCMWLEYDLLTPAHVKQAQPSLSLLVDPDYFRRQFMECPNDPALAIELAQVVLRLSYEPALAASMTAAVNRCVERLPEAGRLVYVSPMLGRVPAVTKLYLVLPKQQVTSYLTDIGWSGASDRLQSLLQPYCARLANADSVYIDLTLAPQVMPRIGIAMSQLQAAERRTLDDTWSWVPAHSIAPHKLDCLSRWPGLVRCTVGNKGARAIVRCWLDIKSVLSDAGEVCTKAYLGVMAQHPPRLGAWELV